MFPQNFCGYSRLTSSGAVVSGKPLIFYGYSVLSGAGGVSKPWFIDGAAAGGTVVLTGDPSNGAASAERMMPLPVGTMFSSQCYVSFDANTTAVTIFYTLGA
jgi:hypothetical protein